MQTEVISELTSLCENYADTRRKLNKFGDDIRVAQEKLLRDNKDELERMLLDALSLKNQITEIAMDNPDLFVKPKTITLGGCRLGFRKNQGSVNFENESNTIDLIRKKLADKSPSLIKSVEKLVKAELKKLTVKELSSIGVNIVDPIDIFDLKHPGSELDKLVNALLTKLDLDVD